MSSDLFSFIPDLNEKFYLCIFWNYPSPTVSIALLLALHNWSQIWFRREQWFFYRMGFSKTATFSGWLLILIGSVSFVGFLSAAVISKLLPLSDSPIISAIQNDRWFLFSCCVWLFFLWLKSKLVLLYFKITGITASWYPWHFLSWSLLCILIG